MFIKPVDEWKEEMHVVLHSKQREFELLGYNEITAEDIWRCLKEFIWKGNPNKHLHEVVQDIFHLPIHVYMDYLSFNTLQKDDGLIDAIEAVMGRKQQKES